MVKPITFPPVTTRTNNYDGTGSFYERRVPSKQVKPYNLPAPYNLKRCSFPWTRLIGGQNNYAGMCNAASEKSAVWGVSPTTTWDTFASERGWACNFARAKLLSILNDEAMMVVNYMERQQALDAIIRRGGQLLDFIRALRRGNVVKAAKVLGCRAPVPGESAGRRHGPKTWRSKTKRFADDFLEWHFGWKPLVADIGNAVELLQGPVPFGRFKARGRKVKIDRKFTAVNQVASYLGFVQAECGCCYTVTNPNLYLANKLGFVNPAAIAWELVPFSFVVDWFVNVGDFLTQSSELYGLTISDPYTTQLLVISPCSARYQYSYAGRFYGFESLSMGVWLDRAASLPEVKLGIRPAWRLSPMRAATAISLLVQKGFK